MKSAQIYSTNGALAYQYGNSRTLVTKGGAQQFQVYKKVGLVDQWVNGRNRHAHDTIDKVKAILGEVAA